MNNPIHTGGCLCGAVRFEIAQEPATVTHCHCTLCRKHSGAAFLTYAALPREAVKFSGPPLVDYSASAQAIRSHCSICGSPISFVFSADPDTLWLTAGSFDAPERLQPVEHIFMSSAMPWLHLNDTLPQSPTFPPDGPAANPVEI
jgi:hypothetical protein